MTFTRIACGKCPLIHVRTTAEEAQQEANKHNTEAHRNETRNT